MTTKIHPSTGGVLAIVIWGLCFPIQSRAHVAVNPLQVVVTDFECDEGYFDKGFESCEVEVTIEVSIPAIYSQYLARSVEIHCDVEVEYETRDSYLASNERESDYTTLSLSRGRGYETLTIEVDFGYNFSPVVKAEVSEVTCRVGY